MIRQKIVRFGALIRLLGLSAFLWLEASPLQRSFFFCQLAEEELHTETGPVCSLSFVIDEWQLRTIIS